MSLLILLSSLLTNIPSFLAFTDTTFIDPFANDSICSAPGCLIKSTRCSVTSFSGPMAISIFFSPNASKDSRYEESESLQIVFLTLNLDLAIWQEVILHSSLLVTASKIVFSSAPAFSSVIGWEA